MSIKNTKFAILIIALACMSDSLGSSWFRGAGNAAYSYATSVADGYIQNPDPSGRAKFPYNKNITYATQSPSYKGFFLEGNKIKFVYEGKSMTAISHSVGADRKMIFSKNTQYPLFASSDSGLGVSMIFKDDQDPEKYYLGLITTTEQEFQSSLRLSHPETKSGKFFITFYDITKEDIKDLNASVTENKDFKIRRASTFRNYYTIIEPRKGAINLDQWVHPERYPGIQGTIQSTQVRTAQSADVGTQTSDMI